MNKKGFTLTELLLVLVIIAIVVIIAVPNIIESLEESRKNSGESIEKLIIKNLELYNNDNERDLWCLEEGETCKYKNHTCVRVTIEDLYELNPDIDIGECLFRNLSRDEDPLYIKRDLEKNNYKYYAEIVCGKNLKDEDNDKVIDDIYGEFYYESKVVSDNLLNECTFPGDQKIYTVKYDANGGEGPEMPSSTYLYGTPDTLSKNTYTKTGYNFIGWNTDETATTAIYQDGQEINNLTDVENGEVTLFAIWEQDENNVIYNYSENGGTSTEKEHEKIIYGNSIDLNVKASKPGWEFVGWNTNKDATSKLSSLTMKASDVILYAIFKKEGKTYTMTTQKNDTGATGTAKTVSCTIPAVYNNETQPSSCNAKLPDNPYKLTGWTFNGWIKTSGTTTTETSGTAPGETIELTGNTNIIATWKINKYTVNVIVQNGIINDETNKKIDYNKSTTFQLKPNSINAPATVSCTNNQTGSVTNDVLKVSNITNNTVCTVVYAKDMSTLYSDGTLIINELAKDRASNITEHGAVSKEYAAMSASNSYVFENQDSQPWANERDSIKSVEIGQKISPVSTALWFKELTNLETGDLTKLNTSEVVSMLEMFYRAGYNKSSFNLVGLNSWDTSKVTNMKSVFRYSGYGATTYNIGDLSNWDTSQVEDMFGVFHYAGFNSGTFDIGDVGEWNTSKVTTMEKMFSFAGRYATTYYIGDLSNWNTSQVTSMSNMFYTTGYESPTFDIGDIGSWDVSKVTTMSNMFHQSGYKSTTWNIGDLSKWNTSQVTNMYEMFSAVGYSASSLNLGDLGTKQVTRADGTKYTAWDVSNVTTMERMFYYSGWHATSWYAGDLSNWNTGKVTNMNRMFDYAAYRATDWSIGQLDDWDVSNVTDMGVMLSGVGNQTQNWSIGDLSNWNVSNVTNMERMFQQTGEHATNWSIGDLSNWDTSKVTNMDKMFQNAALHSKNVNTIGTLNIPSGCSIDYFLYNNINDIGTLRFKGNLIINGSLSSYSDMFKDSATDSSAKINLYYKNSTAEAIVNELISLYGPNGTISKGNIYKVAS